MSVLCIWLTKDGASLGRCIVVCRTLETRGWAWTVVGKPQYWKHSWGWMVGLADTAVFFRCSSQQIPPNLLSLCWDPLYLTVPLIPGSFSGHPQVLTIGLVPGYTWPSSSVTLPLGVPTLQSHLQATVGRHWEPSHGAMTHPAIRMST